MEIRLRWTQVFVKPIILSMRTDDLFSAKAANISGMEANQKARARARA